MDARLWAVVAAEKMFQRALEKDPHIVLANTAQLRRTADAALRSLKNRAELKAVMQEV